MLIKSKIFKGSMVDIEYLITGEDNKETIMFVHGAGANLRQFILQHKYFSREYRVLSVSLRGHGKSTIPVTDGPRGYTMKKNRDDILEILEHLEIQKIHYVGNSAGGMIGYELADIKPDLFLSFVTYGTTAELKYSGVVVNLIAGIDKLMMKISPVGYCRFVSKHSSKDKSVQDEIYNLLTMSREAVPHFRKNLGNYSYLKTLESMDIPFLLVIGESDHDINKSLKSTLETIKSNKNASVFRLAEAGHFANLDKPEEFNRVIEAFIKRELVETDTSANNITSK